MSQQVYILNDNPILGMRVTAVIIASSPEVAVNVFTKDPRFNIRGKVSVQWIDTANDRVILHVMDSVDTSLLMF